MIFLFENQKANPTVASYNASAVKSTTSTIFFRFCEPLQAKTSADGRCKFRDYVQDLLHVTTHNIAGIDETRYIHLLYITGRVM
jgi:hypothetical protein